MAVCVDSNGERIYLPADSDSRSALIDVQPRWIPDAELPRNPRDFKTPNYGMHRFVDLFLPRQIVSLNEFCDLVLEVREKVLPDALEAIEHSDIGTQANKGDAVAYADAVSTYLAESVSKLVTFHNTLGYWRPNENKSASGFGRQAIAMTWDFVELNPFAGAGGDFLEIATKAAPDVIKRAIPLFPGLGHVEQLDATVAIADVDSPVISTDPPYYDNVVYADMSDFFYVWLRHMLRNVYPDLLGTMLAPKAQELVATPYRFDGDKSKAKSFFEKGLMRAFSNMREKQNVDYPLTLYYAFKQSEADTDAENTDDSSFSTIASTGWETMLEGLLAAGFLISGTWPIRTENKTRILATGGSGANTLASSIVLVCRSRPMDALVATRREFIAGLKRELPPAVKELQQGYIAPVDLAQATIGPGMAVFSRFSQVLDADGSPMHVRAALALINQTLDEFLTEQEGEFDADTRWASAWFEQFGHNEGAFGDAETLSKAKNTSVTGLVHAGILEARAGKVRLLNRDELDADWTPENDDRRTVWEAAQYLIRALDEGGEQAAADLLRRLGSLGETARDLAYRLYSICERKGWASDALAYNMLAAAWPRLTELAARSTARQETLL